ncbi:MAG: GGDEF domain-containing protein [Gammaproteobacteria bacterium]|nr:GGDEF domain-containing protein [Gammaproteobacteria bacterium]
MAIAAYLTDVWSATDFGDPELSGYAAKQLHKDTRTGIQTMAGLALAVQLCIVLLAVFRELSPIYLYTSLLFGLLSLHILISVAFVDDIRALQALGMAFLIIGALTITVLAHRSGDLTIGMMAGVVMLLVVIPLVPWALREASIVVGLTYSLLTLSLVSVPGRFAPGSLIILQALVLGAAVVVVVVTARNTHIRKHDIRARFELESAHSAMQLLTLQDHLTGAWNRRFLDVNFDDYAQECAAQKKSVHIAILDIDNFKGINDLFGHQVGDKILIAVADTFVRLLDDQGRLVRLGGDEFLITYCGDDLDDVIETAIATLQQTCVTSDLVGREAVTLSAGIASTGPGRVANLEEMYKRADSALYAAKEHRPAAPAQQTTLTRTGSWKF